MIQDITFETLTNDEKQRMVNMLDSSARSDIEMLCHIGQLATDDSGTHYIWHDLTSADDDEQLFQDMLQHAIWWLEKRGKLLRRDDNRNLVRVF